MSTYQIAHLHEQGHDMITVPLADRFEYEATTEQKAAFAAHLEGCAHGAGLWPCHPPLACRTRHEVHRPAAMAPVRGIPDDYRCPCQHQPITPLRLTPLRC